jgi:hypothetical protein
MLQDLEERGYLEGDCDDIATFIASLTRSMQYPTQLTAIQSEQPGEYDHVFSEVRIGSAWYPIDLTVMGGVDRYRTFGVMSEPV